MWVPALAAFVAGLVLLSVAPREAMARGKGRHHRDEVTSARKAERARVNAIARQACADAYQEAASRMGAGYLREAKESAGKCADARCGRVIWHECVGLYKRAAQEMATVTPPEKKSADALARAPAEAEAGETPPAEAAPPIAVDEEAEAGPRLPKPRPPALDLTAAGSEGERPPPLLRRKARPARAEAGGGVTWPTYALGGLGLLGVGGYVALTLKGRADNSTLIEACKPDCNPASVHHVRMVYLAADASLGVGLVALAASTWLYVHAGSSALGTVDVQATSSGAIATVGGVF